MSVQPKRTRRALRRRLEGAVLAMSLLFALFCAGLMFAVAGIATTIEYRESLQQGVDMAAIALAQKWAHKANTASLYSEEQWNYVLTAMYFEMLEDPYIVPRSKPAVGEATQVRLQPCIQTAQGGLGINCLDASKRAQDKAKAIARLRHTNRDLQALFDPTNTPGLASEMAGVLSNLGPQITAARSKFGSMGLDWINTEGQGPGQQPVFKCQRPEEYNVDLVYKNLVARANPGSQSVAYLANSWTTFSARAYWKTCADGSGAWCTVDGPDGNREIRVPKAFHTQPTANGALARTNVGYAEWVPEYLKRATRTLGDDDLCLPTFMRDPEQYRIAVRGIGQKPDLILSQSRQNVFIGTFSPEGEIGVADADESKYVKFVDFVEAGQFYLAQASFGLINRGVRILPASVGATSGADVMQRAFIADRSEDNDHGTNNEFSRIPLHLWGTWGAALTRLHYSLTRSKTPPCPPEVAGGTGCYNVGWTNDSSRATVH